LPTVAANDDVSDSEQWSAAPPGKKCSALCRARHKRHTFCSHLAMRGAPARAIQELAGHQDLTTTQRYMHLSPAAIENAIRLLDLPKSGRDRGEMLETAGGENLKSLR
jgi:integrase-like protein